MLCVCVLRYVQAADNLSDLVSLYVFPSPGLKISMHAFFLSCLLSSYVKYKKEGVMIPGLVCPLSSSLVGKSTNSFSGTSSVFRNQ